ncbi:cytochrome P450 [Algiphilus aromaticivorans]|uniref:cytochrome P450 n=1 Tax=Algiphilus aromaticivorans TaxID=382454 RepID=UPI0006943E24|nr:cytochrome P450 [Algiphilus aromaticivorans]
MTEIGAQQTLEEAGDAGAIPLDWIDVSNPELFRDDAMWGLFQRLRAEDPVHYCADSRFGPYWSVTKFKDIMQVETHPEIYSSDWRYGGITIMDDNTVAKLPMFIAMDPPKHDEQRKVVSPIVAPDNLARLEGLIRQRTADALDELPVNETFDWVERVSINLTTKMLATIFDFPFEDRHLLTHWSDIATTLPGAGLIDSEEERYVEMQACAEYMTRLWNARVNAEPGADVISMLAHSDKTRDMTPEEFLGNIFLLIVGGNDTTRNSMSGGLLAFNRFPNEYRKLCANPELVSSAVPEIVRWQTPLAYMRRTATQDTELRGKRIRKGDKVVMWYVSGNRDEESIDDPEAFIIDRARPRHHLSFGFGIHRCVGNRLAELQIRILWEGLLQRWPDPMQIEVVGEPKRVESSFVKGYESLPVRINA